MVGKKVWVRDYRGDFHRRIVWGVADRVVYIVEQTQFDRLSNGLHAPTPIGFPKEDVFTKKPATEKVSRNKKAG